MLLLLLSQILVGYQFRLEAIPTYSHWNAESPDVQRNSPDKVQVAYMMPYISPWWSSCLHMSGWCLSRNRAGGPLLFVRWNWHMFVQLKNLVETATAGWKPCAFKYAHYLGGAGLLLCAHYSVLQFISVFLLHFVQINTINTAFTYK